jgi:hypothetical protein
MSAIVMTLVPGSNAHSVNGAAMPTLSGKRPRGTFSGSTFTRQAFSARLHRRR